MRKDIEYYFDKIWTVVKNEVGELDNVKFYNMVCALRMNLCALLSSLKNKEEIDQVLALTIEDMKEEIEEFKKAWEE